MKSLYESILDTDTEVVNKITKHLALEQIKKIILGTGELNSKIETDLHASLLYNSINRGDKTYLVSFQNCNLRGDFSDIVRTIYKQINSINNVDVNYHVVDKNKIFKPLYKSKTEIFEFKIFFNGDVLLEFWVDDMFVNYRNYRDGLGLQFVFPSKYKQFAESFDIK